jgi:hypothetical protein
MSSSRAVVNSSLHILIMECLVVINVVFKLVFNANILTKATIGTSMCKVKGLFEATNLPACGHVEQKGCG